MVLDDSQIYQRLDPSDMHQRIADLPIQCCHAWEMGLRLPLPEEYSQVNRIVTVGMGGSAIGGDLIAGLASLEEAPSITPVRDYLLPNWVGPQTLVVVSSYSGDTEETLSAFMEALDRGAKIVAITRGGQLQLHAERGKIPLLKIDFHGEPRAAVGYSFLAPLGILSKLRFMKDKSMDLGEAVQVVKEKAAVWSKDNATRHNLAKQIAQELQGRMVVVYGASIMSGVARRWKTQFNENSKSWAFAEELPELNHNSVVGYPLPEAVKERAFVLLLQSSYSHPRTNLRYRVTQEILTRVGVRHQTIEAHGNSALAQMLSTILLGDFISYYLSILNGVDPSPVEVIGYLKERLSEL
ncbi:MAG: bifunctional phosphoglucose/phosphomannose isomerase [Chloroflexi bacterium]|nr:bifunctional phosphoglucose/phosphomannose isomerase [Chloroflexota bacterium]